MTFESWKKRVDNILMNIVEMPSECLPDANWREYYDSEMHPIDAVLFVCDNDWKYHEDLSSFIKETYYD